MTILGIIGGGIAGRSLLFHLAKSGIPFQKIYLFSSPEFAKSCSLNSTAIVAGRGVSKGLSNLGDILFESFELFQKHYREDAPEGVRVVTQFTGASLKIDQFKKRFPNGSMGMTLGPIGTTRDFYHAEEPAFMIHPPTYLNWLLESSKKSSIELIEDLVTNINPGSKIKIGTQGGRDFYCDKLIFAGGVYNQYWKKILIPEKERLSKTVPGSYLEFSKVSFELPSLSLTLDGDNFIYDSSRRHLLMGSTTEEISHELPPNKELKNLYERLQNALSVKLPKFSDAIIRTGLREKASKREPYLIEKENIFALGGYYKNGYSVNLKMSQSLIERL